MQSIFSSSAACSALQCQVPARKREDAENAKTELHRMRRASASCFLRQNSRSIGK